MPIELIAASAVAAVEEGRSSVMVMLFSLTNVDMVCSEGESQ
jgi:hypothetical protein